MAHHNGRGKISLVHVGKRSHINVKAKVARCSHSGEVETQQCGSLDISTWGELHQWQDTL